MPAPQKETSHTGKGADISHIVACTVLRRICTKVLWVQCCYFSFFPLNMLATFQAYWIQSDLSKFKSFTINGISAWSVVICILLEVSMDGRIGCLIHFSCIVYTVTCILIVWTVHTLLTAISIFPCGAFCCYIRSSSSGTWTPMTTPSLRLHGVGKMIQRDTSNIWDLPIDSHKMA